MHFHAVTRAIEVISESARRLPPELQARRPELPAWQFMVLDTIFWSVLLAAHESSAHFL
jgi:hypothetical protein